MASIKIIYFKNNIFSDEVEPINIDPIDANRPETSCPVNIGSAIKHGSVPVSHCSIEKIIVKFVI